GPHSRYNDVLPRCNSAPRVRTMGRINWGPAGRFVVTNGDLFLFLLALFAKEGIFFAQTSIRYTEWVVLGTLLIGLFLVSLACFLPRSLRFGALLTANVLLSLLLLADLLYYRFFNDVASLPTFLHAWQMGEAGSSVPGLLRWQDWGFLFDAPLWVLLLRYRRRLAPVPPLRWSVRDRALVPATLVLLFWGLLQAARADSAEYFNRIYAMKFIVDRLGLFGFHIYDVCLSLGEVLDPPQVSDEDVEKIHQ